jgi:hypothetical protein
MEPRFGHDFSRVRVHTDIRAAESARAVDALAYTVGRDVVFSEEGYTPHLRQGSKLLAHELAHVIQQERGGPSPPLLHGGMLEQTADTAASAFMEGRGPIHVGGASAPGLARQPLPGILDPNANRRPRSLDGSLSKTERDLPDPQLEDEIDRIKKWDDPAITTADSDRLRVELEALQAEQWRRTEQRKEQRERRRQAEENSQERVRKRWEGKSDELLDEYIAKHHEELKEKEKDVAASDDTRKRLERLKKERARRRDFRRALPVTGPNTVAEAISMIKEAWRDAEIEDVPDLKHALKLVYRVYEWLERTTTSEKYDRYLRGLPLGIDVAKLSIGMTKGNIRQLLYYLKADIDRGVAGTTGYWEATINALASKTVRECLQIMTDETPLQSTSFYAESKAAGRRLKYEAAILVAPAVVAGAIVATPVAGRVALYGSRYVFLNAPTLYADAMLYGGAVLSGISLAQHWQKIRSQGVDVHDIPQLAADLMPFAQGASGSYNIRTSLAPSPPTAQLAPAPRVAPAPPAVTGGIIAAPKPVAPAPVVPTAPPTVPGGAVVAPAPPVAPVRPIAPTTLAQLGKLFRLPDRLLAAALEGADLPDVLPRIGAGGMTGAPRSVPALTQPFSTSAAPGRTVAAPTPVAPAPVVPAAGVPAAPPAVAGRTVAAPTPVAPAPVVPAAGVPAVSPAVAGRTVVPVSAPVTRTASSHAQAQTSDPELDAAFAEYHAPAATSAVAPTPVQGTVTQAPEVTAGFAQQHVRLLGRLLGRAMSSSQIAWLAAIWNSVANPGEAATLTAGNSRRLFNNQRARFWRALRQNPQAVQFFTDAGLTFGSNPTSAPYYQLPNGQRVQITIDHIIERQSDPTRALDPNNLQLSFRRENTVVLRLINLLDPFQ